MRSRRIADLQQRTRRLKRSERGLTMIELLVSLSLLILITGSLAAGLQIFRRAFDGDRRAQVASEAEQAIDILANQLAAAFPLADPHSGRMSFDGRANSIAFTRMDQGRANRAGLHKAIIQQTGEDLTMALTPVEGQQNPILSRSLEPIVMLGRVSQIRFGYFGTVGRSPKPLWRAEWSAMEQLPELISIDVSFKNSEMPEASVVVALRQR